MVVEAARRHGGGGGGDQARCVPALAVPSVASDLAAFVARELSRTGRKAAAAADWGWEEGAGAGAAGAAGDRGRRGARGADVGGRGRAARRAKRAERLPRHQHGLLRARGWWRPLERVGPGSSGRSISPQRRVRQRRRRQLGVSERTGAAAGRPVAGGGLRRPGRRDRRSRGDRAPGAAPARLARQRGRQEEGGAGAGAGARARARARWPGAEEGGRRGGCPGLMRRSVVVTAGKAPAQAIRASTKLGG